MQTHYPHSFNASTGPTPSRQLQVLNGRCLTLQASVARQDSGRRPCLPALDTSWKLRKRYYQPINIRTLYLQALERPRASEADAT